MGVLHNSVSVRGNGVNGCYFVEGLANSDGSYSVTLGGGDDRAAQQKDSEPVIQSPVDDSLGDQS